jgi:hypothetical protein
LEYRGKVLKEGLGEGGRGGREGEKVKEKDEKE